MSSLEQRGIEALWDRIGAYCEAGTEAIPERRKGQASQWFERLLSEGITNHLDENATWVDFYKAQKEHVTLGQVSASQAAISCIDWFKNNL